MANLLSTIEDIVIPVLNENLFNVRSPLRVLFLCTGNSCQSQMAEAMVNHDLAGRWTAFNAGTALTGYVHPLALKALEEIGILFQGTSKSVDMFRSQAFDLVITVCADAAENRHGRWSA